VPSLVLRDWKGVELEKLVRTNNRPIKNRRLYRQLQNIEKLPKRDQQALLRTIDAFLAKAS